MTPIELSQAKTLENVGDIAGALKIYRDAYQRSNQDEDALLGIAQCALLVDDLCVSLEFFIKILIVNHTNPWGYLGRGLIMMQEHKDDRALSDIREAIKQDNPPTEVRIDAAAALNDLGYSEEAIEALMPLRDTHFDDSDFRAEWLFSLLVIGNLNHPDILTIIHEEFEKAEKTNEHEPYYHLCNYARMAKLGGFSNVSMLISTLLRHNPELTERARLLGVV